jgi:hypothetical protein
MPGSPTSEEAAVHRFAVGDRVSQSQYGAGTVTAVDERHTIIVFDEHGTRTFITAIVRLEASDTEKPVKAKRTRKTAASKTAASKTAAKASS